MAKQKPEPKRPRTEAQIESEKRTAKKNKGSRRMPSGIPSDEECDLLDALYLKCADDDDCPRDTKHRVIKKGSVFTAIRFYLKHKK